MRPPATADVVGHHRAIFQSTFPRDAGRIRSELPDGEPEDISFGITIGTHAAPAVKRCRGTRPRSIVPRLDDATQEFANTLAALAASKAPPSVAEIAPSLAKLYAKILTVHPFVDGNLRAAFISLQQAILSADLRRMVRFEYEPHDWAIGAALRTDGKQSYEPLASLILEALTLGASGRGT